MCCCIHLHVHIYVQLYTSACAYLCAAVYICKCIFMCSSIDVCVYLCAAVYICMCIFMCSSIDVCVYLCAAVYMCMCIFMCSSIHMCIHSWVFNRGWSCRALSRTTSLCSMFRYKRVSVVMHVVYIYTERPPFILVASSHLYTRFHILHVQTFCMFLIQMTDCSRYLFYICMVTMDQEIVVNV